MIITVEGNIGSGKSTLIKYMKENLTNVSNVPVVYLPEPVHLWENIKSENDKNMIQLFYENQKKYSFSFQMMAYISRLQIFKDAIRENPDSIIITERCLLTDYNIFAKMLYESGKMLKEEYEIYKQWFEYFNEIKVHQFIYIKTDPEVSYQRCVKRSRSGENNITLEYLQTCNKMHEDWFAKQHDNVHIIDGNIDNSIFNSYDLDLLRIKFMIQTDLKSQHLKNIMICMNDILMKDINQPNEENEIITDDDRDELSDPKSDDSSYQLSEKDSDVTLTSEDTVPSNPIDPNYNSKPKQTLYIEMNIGLFEIVVISSLIGLYYMK